MSLTVQYDMPKSERMTRSLGIVTGSIAFDSSYLFGGEDFSDIDNKLKTALNVDIQPTRGFTFWWRKTAKTINVFQDAPAMVYEEKHTAVGGLITLDYPAAWIVNVCQAGQHMAWGQSVAFASLAANTFCIVGTIQPGVRTQIYTDGATDTVYVTYATQAWNELYECLVQEEVIASLSGAVAIANQLMAFGFCELVTTGIMAPIDFDDTTATGEVGVDYGQTAALTLDFAAADAGEAGVITYLKLPASGFLADRFVADEDPTKAGADPYTQAFNKPLLLWCISGYAAVTGQASKVLIDVATTAAAGEAVVNWWGQGHGDLLATIGVAPAASWAMGLKDNHTVTAGCYLFGNINEVQTVPIEVKNGTDLSSLLTNVKFKAVGLV